MVVYTSAKEYIDGVTDLHARLARIDAVILALEGSALKAAATGEINEYTLDDGQTKISQVYRNPSEIERSITAYEKIRERIINKLTGRMVQLSDQSNFRRRF